MLKRLITAALLSAPFFTGTATAAPIDAIIADGETFCESLNRSVFSSSDCDSGGNRDLSNSLFSLDALTFAGTGRLAGYVADAKGTGNGKYPDIATITLQKDSKITLTLIRPGSGFDARLTFGDDVSAVVSGAAPSFTFTANAGEYFFVLDATKPSDSASFVASSYVLDLVAVPVPAGSLLLASGLFGFGLMRRKCKS